MPITFNEKWLDREIRQHLMTQMISSAITRDAIRLLDDVEADLRERLGRSAHRAEIYRYVRELRGGAWRRVSALIVEQMEETAVAEAGTARQTMNELSPVVLDLAIPSATRLRRLARITPIDGQVLQAWLQQAERRDVERINQNIRIGIAQGEDNDDIVRRVLGTRRERNGATNRTRNAVRSVVRTATNQVANTARQEFYQENSDLFDEELYVATLDSRTTIQCASLDGRRFEVGKGPMPPIHFNCRSTRIPVISEQIGVRPAVPVVERQLLREYARNNQITAVTARSRLPRGHRGRYDEFARGRKRELIGKVPAKTTYSEFLSNQSAEFQRTVLGETRYRLWRDGGLPLSSFVDRRNLPYSIARLREIQGEAFERVGL